MLLVRLQVAVEAGKLVIKQEGRLRKFRRAVHEKTFAGASGSLFWHGEGGLQRTASLVSHPPSQHPKPGTLTSHAARLPCAAANGRTVLFITERAVFRIVQQQEAGAAAAALELLELAPGIDLGAA